MSRNIIKYLLLFEVLFLISCSGEKKPTNHTIALKDTFDLKIGLMPVTDCLPFYVAGYSRIFKKEGIKVKIITYRSSLECGAAIRDAKIDGAYLTLPELVYLDGQGIKLMAVMGTEGKMTVITSRTKRIKKLSNMKERTRAISRHNTSDYLLDEIAEITNIKPFQLLRPQINDIAVRKSMLENNQVDAAAIPSPYDDISILHGNVKVFSTENSKIKFGSLCFRDTIIKRKEKEIRKLLASYSEAGHMINKNRDKADSVLMKIYRISEQEKDSLKLPKFGPPERVDVSDLKKAATWCFRRKFVRKYPNGILLYDKFIRR